MSDELLPNSEDERWQGADSEGVIRAACVDMKSVKFCKMKDGGPYDGGMTTVLEFAVKKSGGKYAEPVSIILSPEANHPPEPVPRSVGLIGACLGVVDRGEDGDDWAE